jgi:hypothetical protein
MSLSRARLLFGTDEPLPGATDLRAGALSLALRAGRLWHLCAGGVEVWHAVAFLYRDPDWGTPEPVVVRRRATIGPRSFRIHCSGYIPTTPRIDFKLDFEGTSAGLVRVTGEAVPRGDIGANRLGLCVMHSMALARRRVEVLHVDGRTSCSTFPELIPAWPPFMLVRAIRHEYAPGHWARCTFEGDDFELEDQRNNADASFKTYSRSNMMPRPYVLRGGVPIRQAVELALTTPPPRARARRDEPVTLHIGRGTHQLPSIGVEITAADARASASLRAPLRALRPGHLQLAIGPAGATIDWQGVRRLLDAAGARLRLDVALGDEDGAQRTLSVLRDEVRRAGVLPESMAVFSPDPRGIDAARRAFPRTAIGGGTPHFFVQLNRAEQLGGVDFLTFTTCPIVHGADDASVMASLQSLPSMCATLRARFPGVRIRIGPSGIAARASPLGGQPRSDGTRRIALARQDPRSRGLFGAAWLLGYVAQIAASEVDAVTLMSLTGASGVTTELGSRLGRFPTFHALACLQGITRVRDVRVSDASRLAALAVHRDGAWELLLANLTDRTIDVDLPARARLVSVLDARSWRAGAATTDPWRSITPLRRGSVLRVALDALALARASLAG